MYERLKKILPVLILALLGLGISVVAEAVHLRLAANPNYTSFCNISATINCDVVMGSRYAQLLGVSVSLWAVLYYLALIGLAAAFVGAAHARLREKLATVGLLLASWGLLFSAYMAVIAFGVLHSVCVMCSGLYLVNIGMFPAAWRLRSRLQTSGRQQAAQRHKQDRLVLVGVAIAALVLLAIGSWEAFGRGVRPSDAAAIARLHPDFYRWYMAQPVTRVPLDGGHSRGNADATVAIVEFSDFECGHCAKFHASLDDVLLRVGQDIRVVFHHFPLDSECNPKVSSQLHRDACLAAVGSECAADQGKFWQYHNLLFDNQERLGRQSLIEYATQLGLDLPRFTQCLDSPQARTRVEQDINEAAALGIDSTPTVFINGRLIKGALEPDLLSDAVTLARPASPSH
ncbi:MAG: thioredoxin domain-containing protein [Candidatus Binatia bacterium]